MFVICGPKLVFDPAKVGIYASGFGQEVPVALGVEFEQPRSGGEGEEACLGFLLLLLLLFAEGFVFCGG